MDDHDEQYHILQAHLTPTKEEQAWLILQGKCPHNGGWRYLGHGHNDETWECSMCRETKDY